MNPYFVFWLINDLLEVVEEGQKLSTFTSVSRALKVGGVGGGVGEPLADANTCALGLQADRLCSCVFAWKELP